MEKFRGMEVLFWNDRKSAFVCFSFGDMGKKFKVYSCHDEAKRYELSFGTQGEAVAYAKKIF